MHSFFRAVGYSDIANSKDTEKLIDKILKDPSTSAVIEGTDYYPMKEFSYEVAPNVGIKVRCEMNADKDENDSSALRVLNYFPFLNGTNISMQEDIFISKKVDTRAYSGMCDDGRLGVALIFHLLNAVDYLNSLAKSKDKLVRPVMLSALSIDGRILLPTMQYDENPEAFRKSSEKHAKLVNDAQKGDPVAIESLTKQNMDLYAEVCDRARTEDIFSIVSTTFIPYGAESDVYAIVGVIEEWKPIKNKDTGEELCLLTVNCNGVTMDICINRDDLLGEPAVGRRFRGTVWIQGLVEFA